MFSTNNTRLKKRKIEFLKSIFACIYDFSVLKFILFFRADELWKPDILLYNNADSANVKHYGDTHCLVDQNGKVLWVPPGHFKAYCKLQLKSWPFDTQTCQLKFGSWTSHGNQINLHLYRY